jgi:hypothetical protein
LLKSNSLAPEFRGGEALSFRNKEVMCLDLGLVGMAQRLEVELGSKEGLHFMPKSLGNISLSCLMVVIGCKNEEMLLNTPY